MSKAYSFIVLFNPSSGAGLTRQAFEDELEHIYPAPQYRFRIIEIHPGLDLEKEIPGAAKETRHFVIAGGDGTVRECIQYLADLPDIVITVIPLGTFNHFAKDTGQSVKREKAIQAIGQGHIQTVDLAQVNDLYFTNVSTLGIYTRITRHKEKLRKKGLGRLLSAVVGTWKAVREFKPVRITARTDHTTLERETSVVFVGNNLYELEKEQIGTRKNIDQHRLHFFVLKKVTLWRAGMLIFHSLRGTLKQQNEFEDFMTNEITITSSLKSTSVSLDGEVYQLDFPLQYRILPNQLRIKVFKTAEHV